MSNGRLFGLDFFDGEIDEAADAALSLPADGRGLRIVTPNSEIVLNARKDRALQEALSGADLILPDGVGLLLASRMTGRTLKNRIPGIDFAGAMMARLAGTGEGVFLLGAKPGVAEEAACRLQARYPGLRVVGTQHGYYAPEAESEIVGIIKASGARFVLVCLGSPRQELWMQKYAPELSGCLMAGLGGALDVFAGRIPRAPESWRAIGLEWLYRLLREPGRIGRVCRLPGIILAAYQEKRQVKNHG